MTEEKEGPQQLEPEYTPGSLRWCRQLRALAMEAMLRRAKKATHSAGEVKHMVKLRKSLSAMVHVRQPVRWQDPISWTSGQEPDLERPAA